MTRAFAILLTASTIAFAGKNEPAPVDAPYNKVFDAYRACWAAKDLAKRGAPDALRTCFLAAYVRVNQPFLGGEDLVVIDNVFYEIFTARGDRRFAAALVRERPEIRSAVRWFMGSDPRLKRSPKTDKVFREAPTIDWPINRAYRNDL